MNERMTERTDVSRNIKLPLDEEEVLWPLIAMS